ncbi:hypothetical protein NPIL_208271 [Nephila pilipes]|uniref:Uncharacterized protein n=1 Tax=Nephila pilipes TaxID=299642 RepID=A0A8X6NLF1_NEPPI|nr:hypothetical protein NPIL_208271 [Nephila pilipes]
MNALTEDSCGTCAVSLEQGPNLRRKHSGFANFFSYPPPSTTPFILLWKSIHICSENMLPASTISPLSTSFNGGFRNSLLDNGLPRLLLLTCMNVGVL